MPILSKLGATHPKFSFADSTSWSSARSSPTTMPQYCKHWNTALCIGILNCAWLDFGMLQCDVNFKKEQSAEPRVIDLTAGVGIRTLDNSDSRARLGQNGLGSAFGRTNPQKSVGQARTIGQIRTTRPLFGHSARFGHSDSSDNSDKAEPSFPANDTHPIYPITMSFSSLLFAESVF